MKTFLEEIAEDIYKEFGADMSRIAIIFPNKRTSIFMDEYFFNAIKDTPIWAPSYYSIGELYDSLCPLKQDDPIRSIFLLYNTYKKTLQGKDNTNIDINYFYSWGQQLLNDFNNIDKNMVDAERILTNASEIWELEDIEDNNISEKLRNIYLQKKTDSNNSEIKKDFQQIWKNLFLIYSEFNKQLENRGEAYSGMRYRIVTERLEKGKIKLPEQYTTYIFIGFNTLLASERRLMKFIQQNKQTFFYWDCDKFFMDKTNEFSFCQTLKNNLSDFPNKIKFEERSNITTQNLEYIATSSNNAQAHFVTSWIKENLTQKENHTAIILCDENLLEAVLHAIPSNEEENGVKEVNVTKGFPVGNTPAYDFVCQYLKKELVNSQTNSFVLLEELAEKLREQAQELLSEYPQNTWEGNLYAESYFQCYTSVIRLKDILNENILPVNSKTLEMLLLQILHSQSIPFKGEPATGLQIMGMLETRNLDFEEILMLSVAEGNIPKKNTDHSFLPYDLRKSFKLTTMEQESEIYAYNFFRLLQRCKHITYMYNQEGEQNAEKSRFLQQILINTNLQTTIYNLSESQENSIYQYNDISSEEVQDLIKGVKKIAPTAINHYTDCPMKFYFSDIAHLTEDILEQEILPSNTLGSIFHETIRLCFNELIGKKEKDKYGGYPISSTELSTLAEDDLKIDNFLKEAALTISGEDFFNYPDAKYFHSEWKYPNFDQLPHTEKKKKGIQFIKEHPEMALYKVEDHIVEFGVLKKYLKNTLKFDSQWTDLHIIAMEKRYNTKINDIAIGGFIDRLDVVTINSSPTLRIVDYKTGSYNEKKTTINMEELFSSEKDYHYAVQTFIYSQACVDSKEPFGYGLPVAPVLLFIQKTGAEGYSPYIKDDENKDISDFKTQVSTEFKEELQEIIQKIKTEKYSFRPEPECKYCPYTLLCGKKNKATF